MRWAVVEIHHGYMVSDQGDIKSLKTNKLLKPYPRKPSLPYPTIDLWINGKRKSTYVHRLVAAAFVKNKDNKPHVNHKNGIKTDNRYQNLEWVTHKENINHAHINGLVDSSRGEAHVASKLTAKIVLELRKMFAGKAAPYRKLATKYGVDQKTIYSAIKGLTWKHI